MESSVQFWLKRKVGVTGEKKWKMSGAKMNGETTVRINDKVLTGER